MGLIRFAADVIGGGYNATKNTLQSAAWKEYFESGDMSNGILMKRAEKIINMGSKNKKGDNNLISSGSVIDIQEGQCMIITDNGKIVEFCAEPGRFTYNSSSQPSVYAGNNKGLKALGQQILKQWSAGGQRISTQRVYFINLGELIKTPIKWGSGDIAFHHVQEYNTGTMELDIILKGYGQATIRIINPVRFYKKIGAQVAGTDGDGVITLTHPQIMSNLKSAIIDHISSAIATLGTEKSISYTAIRSRGNDIKNIINREISEEWAGSRGFEIANLTIGGSFRPTEEYAEQIRRMQQTFTMAQNQNLMNYDVQKDISEGFREAGASGTFGDAGHTAIVMSAALGNNFGHMQYQQTNSSWTCSCGSSNNGAYCSKCGTKKPALGVRTKKQPLWKCTCGQKNDISTKTCSNCGKNRKPIKKMVCDKCGWTPESKEPVQFCPQCGDILNENDIVEI